VKVRWRSYLYLLLLTVGALLIHGYHPGAEDAEIYIPGVKKLLDPSLYSFGAEFFLNHAKMTHFDELIAASVRISHLSFDLTIFLWYVLSTFLTLVACWRLSAEFFEEAEARWASVALVAALLTIPVAGTSLYIADQYLTPRSIVTFAVLFATLSALKGRTLAWALWGLFAVIIHPLMAAIGLSFTFVLWWMKPRRISFAAMLPLVNLLPPETHAYQQAVSTRSYFFLLRWEWYEWVGALAPLVLLWMLAHYSKRESDKTVQLVSRSLVLYGLVALAIACVMTIPERFQTAARFQPMRSFHLIYIMMFLLMGGLLGRYMLKRQAWRWVVLFLPLSAGMFLAQRDLFSASVHIEWPNRTPSNDWLRAFDWIRTNTPHDALFAIDPDYMKKDDQHGFRAIAERSRLADAVKDAGAVTMFPDLPTADHWLEQLNAQTRWAHFQDPDFERLARDFGVSWIVVERPLCPNFTCPYENATLRVCRIK
jgi:hypothetical protein